MTLLRIYKIFFSEIKQERITRQISENHQQNTSFLSYHLILWQSLKQR